jgi:hypothetical protein
MLMSGPSEDRRKMPDAGLSKPSAGNNISGYQQQMSVINNNTILLILSLFVIRFIHGKYNYIPDTNHVSRLYRVASILWLQFSIHVILYTTKTL